MNKRLIQSADGGLASSDCIREIRRENELLEALDSQLGICSED